LVLVERSELDAQLLQMESGYFFVQLLGQDVDSDGILAGFSPQLDLGQSLVREGAAHDERRMAHSATQVDQTALGKKDDVTAVG